MRDDGQDDTVAKVEKLLKLELQLVEGTDPLLEAFTYRLRTVEGDRRVSQTTSGA